MRFRESATLMAGMAGAAIMMAHQVAGKAARDGIFLSEYPVTSLPAMVIAAAVVSVVVGLFYSRLLSWGGPRTVVPVGFFVSAALHVAEWALLGLHPKLVAPAVYLHIVGLGAILLSGFWSLANEIFDPRLAKGSFGRIAGAGTAGGIAGGLLAERTAALLPAFSILPLLGAFHLLCGAVLLVMLRESRGTVRPSPAEPILPKTAFHQAPYLRTLAVLVLLGTTGAAVIDYLFKSGAAATFGRGDTLIRFFAVFYTSAQILTFLIQTLLTRPSLEKLGLGGTIRILPLTMGLGSAAGLVIPAFPVLVFLRGAESILRGSLFRSGYELFYTPVPAAEKRAVKTLIDVAFDRAGDAVGAGIVQMAIWLAPDFLTSEILGVSLLVAVIAAFAGSRLDKSYSDVLERGLRGRAIELDLAHVEDSTTLSAFLRTTALQQIRPPSSEARPAQQRSADADDPVLDALHDLRSGDRATVLRRLSATGSLDPLLAQQVIRLLAWDDVADAAREALERDAARYAGTLADRVLDPAEDFSVRRRVPRILARVPQLRAAEALLGGLEDERFEVRFQCARALHFLHQNNREVAIPAAPILASIERELNVPETIWRGRALLEKHDAIMPFAPVEGGRAAQPDVGTEHLFSLLAAILPREPLEIAYRSVHTDDQLLRGLAFEYLASQLPPEIWRKMAVRLEAPHQTGHVSPETALDQLLRSSMASKTARGTPPTESAGGGETQSG